MNYRLNPELIKIQSPVILVINGNEEIYRDGRTLTELTFDKNYIIEKITARDDFVVIALKQNEMINNITWSGEEAISFF